MVDPISSSTVRPPQELTAFNVAEADPGQVSSADQQRFEAGLGTNGTSEVDGGHIRTSPADAGDVWVQQPVQSEPQPPLPPTLGESVLNGIEHLRQSWENTVAQIQETVSHDNLRPSDLMQLQFQVQHTGVVTTLVVNEISSLDQEVTQLLKAS